MIRLKKQENILFIRERMDNKPEVSVVITTYKRPGKLGRAIKSVLDQTLKDWELIVVDDNNADTPFRQETESFMEPYLADSRIRYIKHEKNAGAPAARNTGIKAAVGTYIALLDDDDEFESTKLEKQLALFKARSLRTWGLSTARTGIWMKAALCSAIAWHGCGEMCSNTR